MPPKKVDPTICPQCGDPMKLARGLDQKEYDTVFDAENPTSMPHGVDTAPPDQRAALGALYRCRECGYRTRVKDAPVEQPA